MPPNDGAFGVVSRLATLGLYPVLDVEVVHRFKPCPQAVRWDKDVNVVRKFLLD